MGLSSSPSSSSSSSSSSETSFSLVVLEVQNDLGTAGEVLVRVRGHGEGTAGSGLPDVLLVVVVLGVHGDGVRDEECRVETDAKLADHRDVGAGLHGLHEGLGAGLGDG